MRRRPEIHAKLSREGEYTRLYFHGKQVHMPDFTEPDLRYITGAEEFSAADLPGELDEEGKLVLVRRLIEEGYLTICR